MEGIDNSRVHSGYSNNAFNSAPEEIPISSQSKFPLQTKPVNSIPSDNSEKYGRPISNFNSTHVAPTIPGMTYSNFALTQSNNSTQFTPGTNQTTPGTTYSNLAVMSNGQLNNYSTQLAQGPQQNIPGTTYSNLAVTSNGQLNNYSTQLAQGPQQNIPGTTYSNLAVTSNGQINNYSTSLAQGTQQIIPGPTNSNLAVSPTGQIIYYPPHRGPNNNVYQAIATSIMSTDIDENLLRMQRRVNVATYIVLLISGLAVLIGYSILLEKIASVLDLFEIGNWWMFVNIFLSCTVTILLCGFAVGLTFCSKGQIGHKHVTWINVGLFLFVILPAFLAPIGIAESSGKKRGPQELTNFGLYDMAICGTGNSSAVQQSRYTTPPSIALKYSNVKPDPAKCDALRTLKYGIFCSFAWAIEHILAFAISGKFGMRFFKLTNHNINRNNNIGFLTR